MAIIAKNIEQQIEEAIITLLQADTYISTNSIPVRGWFDRTTEVSARQVIIHANAAIPSLIDEDGEAKEYEVLIDLISDIHNTEDETPNAETDTLYQILVGFTEQTTKAQIEAELTELTINGKHTSPYGEDYEERFYNKGAAFTIFVQSVDTDYLVAGAGSSDANGNYYEAGTYNGAPYYKQLGIDYFLFYDEDLGIPRYRWILDSALGESGDYVVVVDNQYDPVPETGWVVRDGDAPAPTVTSV